MSRGKWLLLIGIALAVILLDQVTKAIIVANLAPYESWAPIEALSPIFEITHVRNTGAAFGILPGGGMLFQLVAVVVVCVILYFYRQLTDRVWLVRVALGLQLGGAISNNLIDRVRQGYVTDFLHLKILPVFNIADASIVVGVGLLLLIMWREDRLKAAEERREESSRDTSTPKAPEDEPSSITPQ